MEVHCSPDAPENSFPAPLENSSPAAQSLFPTVSRAKATAAAKGGFPAAGLGEMTASNGFHRVTEVCF